MYVLFNLMITIVSSFVIKTIKTLIRKFAHSLITIRHFLIIVKKNVGKDYILRLFTLNPLGYRIAEDVLR